MSEASSGRLKSLPPNPNLNWLKNRAKERLGKLRDANAVAKLADAQLEIAREYGFVSWQKLKAAVDHAAQKGERDQPSLLREFRDAVKRGDVEAARWLLEGEPLVRRNVNAPLFDFDSRAISHARRNPQMVDLLLQHGADINLKSAWWAGGWGVLETADPPTADFLISRGAIVDVFAATHLDRLDRMKELLDADPALVDAKGGDGCRPLHFARSSQAIDLLLDRGAQINARDVDHESTAAQWAMPRPPAQRRGVEIDRHLEAVRHLLTCGAQSDIFMATALDDVELLARLLEQTPGAIDLRVGGGNYPPCPKAPGGHIYVYTLMAGKSPHQVAADFASRRCLELLWARSDPRQRFVSACSLGDEASARAALAQSPGLVASLSPDDLRALPDAAFNGNAAAVKLMLDLGFSPLSPGGDGGTALHCAGWHGARGNGADDPEPSRRAAVGSSSHQCSGTDASRHAAGLVLSRFGQLPQSAGRLSGSGKIVVGCRRQGRTWHGRCRSGGRGSSGRRRQAALARSSSVPGSAGRRRFRPSRAATL